MLSNLNIYKALYNSLKEMCPTDLKITFNNLDENSENCSFYFKGSSGEVERTLSGGLINRKLRLVLNYNTVDVFVGYDYGERVIEAFNKNHNIAYENEETKELVCYISDIKLMGNVNYLGKNRNNGLNCFSINFIVTYGKL